MRQNHVHKAHERIGAWELLLFTQFTCCPFSAVHRGLAFYRARPVYSPSLPVAHSPLPSSQQFYGDVCFSSSCPALSIYKLKTSQLELIRFEESVSFCFLLLAQS